MAGEGPCDSINSSGGIAKKPLARLEHVIHSYEAALVLRALAKHRSMLKVRQGSKKCG